MTEINISQVDTVFANGGYPIEFLIYYKNRINKEQLIKSIERLSDIYWPLYGSYKNGKIYQNAFDLEKFVTEIRIDEYFCESDNQLIKFGSNQPQEFDRLFSLRIIHMNNGDLIIPKLNHIAGDGYSYFYFLSAVAALSKDPDLKTDSPLFNKLYVPHHERTALKDFSFDHNITRKHNSNDQVAIDEIQIKKSEVKDFIKDIYSKQNMMVSTNDVLSAMIMKRTSKNFTFRDKATLKVTMPIDVRRHVKSYGHKFIGNGLMFNVTELNYEEIMKSDIDSIAIKIRSSMPIVNEESYWQYLNSLEKIICDHDFDKLTPYDPEDGCLITNLSMLPVSKLDFGSGNPDFISLLTVGKNSTAILSNNENFILRIAG